MPVDVVWVPGSPSESGYAHGRVIADLLSRDRLGAFLHEFCRLKRTDEVSLRANADDWLAALPIHFAEEIEAMGAGAGVSTNDAAALLYADIAQPTQSVRAASGTAAAEIDGPMCSGVMADAGREVWAARNCDWYRALLMRGTAAVGHAVPGRVPILALGIAGDIDVDTGLNAEGLWLHMHTLHSVDPAGDASQRISWLFWCRECLETCSTLDEVEAFVARTVRDRGVLLFAAEGKTGERAIFECGRSTYQRLAGNVGGLMCATNHRADQHPSAERAARARPSTTSARYARLRGLLDNGGRPEHGPDDFIDLLADEGVEMRTPPELRTIYAAVCAPRHGRDAEIWFAAGTREGEPASSSGRWEAVRVPW